MTIEERIEAAAQLAFEAMHSLHHRRRFWDRHPDEDCDAELGRNTFRHMVRAMMEHLRDGDDKDGQH